MASICIPKTPSGSSAGAKKDKPKQIRETNIFSAKAVGDAIRTSLGPRGMDKMIVSSKNEVTITNDGATILKEMGVIHPVAQMLVELAKAQDVEAGDGTTTVVVIASSLLSASLRLLDQGLHPTTISEGFQIAATKAQEILRSMAIPVDLTDRASLIQSAITSLSSKVVSQNSILLAPISVDAVLQVMCSENDRNVDLRDIRVVTKLGGTLEDSELIQNGIVLNQRASHAGGDALTRVENAKIAVIQFCISPPKTNIDNNVIVTDYTQMDRILREEKQYLAKICKEIQKSGCNVILIQKSILRDAVTETALHFLNRMKIMVVRDVERTEVELICKTLNCRPIASVDHMKPDFLGSAKLVEEISSAGDRFIKISDVTNPGKTVTVLIRGSNSMILEEAERSLHDSLCVVRCLVKNRNLISGGGAAEIEMSLRLGEYSRTLSGLAAVCVKAFGEALELIPITLAENGGLNSIDTITELRKQHHEGNKNAGINIAKGCISDMKNDMVISPLLVISSAVSLASETVRCILKIDDMVQSVR